MNAYLNERGNNSATAIDPYHGMTPLHMLTTNSHAPADSIASLLNINMKTAFCLYSQRLQKFKSSKVQTNLGHWHK